MHLGCGGGLRESDDVAWVARYADARHKRSSSFTT
jgi:hypothetical protein